MELCMTKKCCTNPSKNLPYKNPDSQVKKCLQEYELQDKVEALKNYLRINDSPDRNSHSYLRSDKSKIKKFGEIGVKECLQPSLPSPFQILVTELRDTVRSSYWNKEIGKTIYLVPHLPAGCDPLQTTFGKTTARDVYGVAEILKPRDNIPEDMVERTHALYRKSHNDYNPSEQVDRNYGPPFHKLAPFGGKKVTDFSGKKAAKCIRWINPEPLTLVSRRLAEYYNRSQPRVGRVKSCEVARARADLTFGRNPDQEIVSVANTLSESSAQQGRDNYCSEYAEQISKSCESWKEKIGVAGLQREGMEPLRTAVPTSALKCDGENLGDQTTTHALVSPNIFTQMGLSHVDFFKVCDYKEIRSIFENIGINFPGNSFDVLWEEGLAKDSAGGVCVETFRNLLPKLAETICHNESM